MVVNGFDLLELFLDDLDQLGIKSTSQTAVTARPASAGIYLLTTGVTGIMICSQVYNHVLYLTFWGVNAAVLFVLGRVFPEQVALGVNKFAAVEAAVYAGFWLTFIVWTLWDFLMARGVKFGSDWTAYTYFFAANAVGVGIVSMFSQVTGVRVMSLGWVLVAGGLVNLFQNLVKEKLLGSGGGVRRS